MGQSFLGLPEPFLESSKETVSCDENKIIVAVTFKMPWIVMIVLLSHKNQYKLYSVCKVGVGRVLVVYSAVVMFIFIVSFWYC